MRLFTIFLALVTIIGATLHAQPSSVPAGSGAAHAAGDPKRPDEAPNAALKRMMAVHLSGGAPHIDGRLVDDAWSTATFRDDFLQKEPAQGVQPSERTEVAFAYDDHALYVAARCHASHPDNVQAIVTRRDNSGSSERFIVTLDTYHDRRTAYSFSVTAAGVRTDYYHGDDNEFSRQYSFDPVWEARVANDSTGWTAEMRIPFSQLRFNDQEEQVWGLNMDRYMPSKNEDIYWIPIPKNQSGWSSQFGELRGIRGIKPSTRLELLPYAAIGSRFTGERDPANPFDDGRNIRARGGLDMKMGIGPNLTVDATINPDFGQVEADPATVNLSAYESIFDERRPFFIEGKELFTPAGGYFYSRRIGAPPHGPASGSFVDYPGNTTILGAGKLTGRLPSGLSVGGLAAITKREFARTWDAASDTYRDVEVEPPTGYAVARVLQETDSLGSELGGILTYVRRDIAPGAPLAQRLTRDAISGGSDFRLRFAGGTYEVRGHLGGSYIDGDSAAITRVQRSSAHYFQRPDATHISYDPSRTSLAGLTADVTFEKRDGEHWLGGIGLAVETPGLELNDIGRLQSGDDLDLQSSITYRENTPGPLFYNYSATFKVNSSANLAFDSPGTIFILSGDATFKNFWGMNLYADYGTVGVVDDYTRGGPMMGVAWNADGGLGFWTSYGSPTRLSLNINAGLNGDENWYVGIDATLTSVIGDRLELSISPTFSRQTDTRQYVGTFGGGRTETYGRRYVFGTISRATLSAPIRASYAITPDLSVEAYAEPFAASGHYDRFGELSAPRQRKLNYYGEVGSTITDHGADGFEVTDGGGSFTIDPQDFLIASFRSNVVLRWEWLRGSTLFLVWQQDRFRFDRRGDLATPHDLFNSVTATGDNFLTLKLTYWIPG